MTNPFDFKRENRGADQMRLAEPAAALVRPSSSGAVPLTEWSAG
jgi:hypothetical protein